MDLHDKNEIPAADDLTPPSPRDSVPSGEPAPGAYPVPPWVREKKSAGEEAQPSFMETLERAAEESRKRARRRRTGAGLCLALALILSLCLGGAVMFFMIYSGALTAVEARVSGFFHGGSSAAQPYEIPEEKNEEPRQDTPQAPPQTPSQTPSASKPEEETAEPFRPIEDPPKLRIVPISEDGADAREELSIPDIAELAKPSVVGIIKYYSDNPMDGYTIGSGTIFSEDGYIITNAHVVSDSFGIVVLLNDGTEYQGTLVVSDSDADIAVVKIEAEGLVPAEFGDSSQLRVGEISVAIGCPASVDLQGTTTSGIISALDRVITVDSRGRTMRLLQTDAAINPGNSGGPLLNRFGQVIGINTVKLSSATYEGLCFAIPSAELEHIVSDLFTWGYVRGYPAIGITARTVDAAEDEYGGAPAGVWVATVNPGSGAYGLVQEGDIIIRCNGTEVITVAQINTIKNRLRVGDTITLTVYRQGEIIDVDIVLVDQYDLAEE